MDKNYSETDFEYLPNGGWGENAKPAMWTTSWDTFQLEPWTKVNEFSRKEGSYAGWHTLVLTVADKKLIYYVDGQLFSEHSSAVYPEDFMSINFNLWFMPKGADGSQGPVDSPRCASIRKTSIGCSSRKAWRSPPPTWKRGSPTCAARKWRTSTT